jgi:hypothetical protein
MWQFRSAEERSEGSRKVGAGEKKKKKKKGGFCFINYIILHVPGLLWHIASRPPGIIPTNVLIGALGGVTTVSQYLSDDVCLPRIEEDDDDDDDGCSLDGSHKC